MIGAAIDAGIALGRQFSLGKNDKKTVLDTLGELPVSLAIENYADETVYVLKFTMESEEYRKTSRHLPGHQDDFERSNLTPSAKDDHEI